MQYCTTDRHDLHNNHTTKRLAVLAVILYGRYEPDGAIIDDKCPCCSRDPFDTPEGRRWRNDHRAPRPTDEPIWHLGEIWAPGAERAAGARFRVFQCQGCGLIYATHLNYVVMRFSES
jgi:hypothetical protein